MQDFKDILRSYKEKLDKEIISDTMEMLEQINPKLTSDSKKYKEGNKYIFKQVIGYENSEDLMSTVIDTANYNVYNLSEYKDNISQKLIYAFEQSENPIEIIIYATRGLKENVYKNAILDVIKDIFVDYRAQVIEAYRNIIINWTWYDCIELVLKSIEQNIVLELKDVVYELFKNNYMLREKAATTLINISDESSFESMINFLVVSTSSSTDDIQMFKNIMYNLGRNTQKGSAFAYKIYSTINCRNQISNALILGIKLNLNKAIYDNIEKRLQNRELDRRSHNKLIDLLERTKHINKISLDILNKALSYEHLDQDRVRGGIGASDIEMQIEMAQSIKTDERARVNSIIKLGKSKDERVNDVLLSLYNESDLIRIVVASALVERGENKELLTLFKYLVGSTNNDHCNAATNQIKRLLSTPNQDINAALIKVIAKFMENNEPKSTERTLKILDLYSSGRPQEEIGNIFLNKLKLNPYVQVKSRLLAFFSKNYTVFSNELRTQIRDEITNCSKIQSISQEAMQALKVITAGESSLPDCG